MDIESLVIKIDSIITYLQGHSFIKPNHKNSCDFLLNEFQKLKSAIMKDSQDLETMKEWSIWFAPRIIYEGINDAEILNQLDEINELLKN